MAVLFPPIDFRIELDWNYPEAARARFTLTEWEAYFAGTEIFLEEAKQEAQIDMASRFDTETDPEGFPWLPLIQPAPEQIGILQLTGELRQAAISDEAYVVTPEGLFFNTGVLPDYWVYHEQPEGEGSQRISRRPFIGLDANTEQKIENRFSEWVDEGIVLGIRGKIRERRNMLGQFAPLI